jgi:hypothetical protein
MRIGLEALDDVDVTSDVREAVDRKVNERVDSPMFTGAQDLRLRLRRTKDALLCVAIVGFAGGDLVTSTAARNTPLEAVVDALEGLSERIERVQRFDRRSQTATDAADRHAAVRGELKRLLDRG